MPRSISRIVASGLITLGVACVGTAAAQTSPAPAAPQGPWGAVSTVTPSGVPSDDPWVATTPGSSVRYAWEGWDGRTWQIRTLAGAMFGYAAFYFVRKNLSFAMPAMQTDLGIPKADLGIFLTLHGLLYGVSRFVNGMWADRANARYFMVAGLLLSVGANVFFGFSSTVLLLGVAWMINGWVQGMGFPPCCRLMTHWFRPERLASTMSVWNTSHSIGAALASVACGYFVLLGWRWCFFGPAILCTAAGIILFILLRDTPSSVGLPEIRGDDRPAPAPGPEENTRTRRQSSFYVVSLGKLLR